ncbi:hypothetical protein [Clostridium sp.]|uniref:hypothetical protein n=1 Tax=Clostridium sp. TaxID=1506 RepID=UPI00263A058C|nr:hypothetical protein [Clostridium sp.]
MEECNHNPNDGKTTIIIDKNRFYMTFPRSYNGICKCCKKSFKYIREDGKYIKK